MRLKKKQGFANAMFFNTITIIVLTVSLLGYLWITNEYQRFNRESERLRKEYIATQQGIIRSEVNRQIDYINYMRQTTEQVLMKNIRSRTNEAYSIAMNLYEKHKDTKSSEEIKRIITEALRPVRFNDGRGYFFIDTLEGDVVLYPILPESEGKNLLGLQDEEGNYALRDEIDLVKRQKEGYITGYWIKPDSQKSHAYKKITFVKEFEPYKWYLGTGEYVDDVEQDIKRDILGMISTVRFGPKNDSYIFVGDIFGVELANGVYPEYVGQNLWDMTDDRGVKVIQEQIKVVKENPEGGILTHYWKSPNSDGIFEKMTFVRAVPEWGWVLGSGISVEEFDRAIANMRKQMEQDVMHTVKNIIMLLAVVLLVAFAATSYMLDKARKSMDLFMRFLTDASKHFVEIDIQKVHYDEFKGLAESANAMLLQRKRVEEQISAINEELECRIHERTKELEELNQNLESKVSKRTQELNRLLMIDSLTQIYNRKYMFERLDKEIKRISGSNKKLCIIMLDIDHFKSVNDNFGHQCGDSVIAEIAKAIKGSIRDIDIAGRYGGEEFIVILPDTDIGRGFAVAERIRQKVMELKFCEISLSVTISGGIVEHSSEKPEELVNKADEKLYQAKNAGRNNIQR